MKESKVIAHTLEHRLVACADDGYVHVERRGVNAMGEGQWDSLGLVYDPKRHNLASEAQLRTNDRERAIEDLVCNGIKDAGDLENKLAASEAEAARFRDEEQEMRRQRDQWREEYTTAINKLHKLRDCLRRNHAQILESLDKELGNEVGADSF